MSKQKWLLVETSMALSGFKIEYFVLGDGMRMATSKVSRFTILKMTFGRMVQILMLLKMGLL